MPIVAHIHFESFFSAAFSWHTGFVEPYASLGMTIYYFSLCHGMSFSPSKLCILPGYMRVKNRGILSMKVLTFLRCFY